jgi:phospholipase/carboxylesterase
LTYAIISAIVSACESKAHTMDSTPLSLTHLVRRPARDAAAPPLLILLHGIGSDEQDLFGLAPYLDERFLIVSARAPHPYGWGGHAWFEIEWLPNGIAIDQAQAEVSRDLIVRFIGEAAAAYGADPARVYLAGFSQGAIMSGWVALTRPDLVAGAALMSGRIPDEARAQIAAPEQLAGKPFLVVHGLFDQVLPIQYGRASRDLLQSLPVELTYREYPMGHEVSAQSLADVSAWLTERLYV